MKLDTPERVLAWAEDIEGCSHPDCGNSVCDEVYRRAERIAYCERVTAIVEREAAKKKFSGHVAPNCLLAEAMQNEGK